MMKSFLLLIFGCAARAPHNREWGSHISLQDPTEVGQFLTDNPFGTRFTEALYSINDKLIINATNYDVIDSMKVLPSVGSFIDRA